MLATITRIGGSFAPMVHSAVAASRQRRLTLAGGRSPAGLGAAVALVIALAGNHVVRSPASRTVVLPVEVVRPAPPAPRSPPAFHAARPARGAGARTRTQHEPVKSAQPVAPVAVRDLADLTISYDDAASVASPGATTNTDGGGSGIGASIATWRGDGIARIDIPQPAASLARPPRPRHDYNNLRIPGASKFAGDQVKLELTIDVHGKVTRVQLLQGVDRALDRKAVALVRTFEYQPALDDAGVAIEGTSRWNLQIVDDPDSEMFDSAREHVRR
ncbi:MAG TPA: energy transducer TonB [Gemmatimonadaceae bacterium]|nr:energy transducer TonB [Gemmatimonadaceae bacterium]